MRTHFGSRVKRFNHLVLKLIDWLSAVVVDSWSIRVPLIGGRRVAHCRRRLPCTAALHLALHRFELAPGAARAALLLPPAVDRLAVAASCSRLEVPTVLAAAGI